MLLIYMDISAITLFDFIFSNACSLNLEANKTYSKINSISINYYTFKMRHNLHLLIKVIIKINSSIHLDKQIGLTSHIKLYLLMSFENHHYKNNYFGFIKVSDKAISYDISYKYSGFINQDLL